MYILYICTYIYVQVYINYVIWCLYICMSRSKYHVISTPAIQPWSPYVTISGQIPISRKMALASSCDKKIIVARTSDSEGFQSNTPHHTSQIFTISHASSNGDGNILVFHIAHRGPIGFMAIESLSFGSGHKAFLQGLASRKVMQEGQRAMPWRRHLAQSHPQLEVCGWQMLTTYTPGRFSCNQLFLSISQAIWACFGSIL